MTRVVKGSTRPLLPDPILHRSHAFENPGVWATTPEHTSFAATSFRLPLRNNPIPNWALGICRNGGPGAEPPGLPPALPVFGPHQ